MATKTLKIADFRERILLSKIQWTTDKELNRIEKIVPVKEVWANIEVKSSNNEKTETGTRPEITYKVIIRKTNVDFSHIVWKGKHFLMTAPEYEIDHKYKYFEMVGIYGDKNIITEFP